jgi:DNA replicative helicase MCM subunit Mcm2 (Cdc46/Mcm family)
VNPCYKRMRQRRRADRAARRAQDRRLSAHVMAVHRDGVAPRQEGGPEPLGADVLRAYIARAKQHDPFFPEELTGARPALR